ncbi:antistasin-like isoform X1 [Littorina saxatilis]|uniref:Antistasin-like domain-containing protein n=1 Tax=Littorina saxatilis TaxID=31220 RepID=A0AAN9FXU9_9CAEN
MSKLATGLLATLLLATCVQSLSLAPVDPLETSPVRPIPFPRCGPVCLIFCEFGNVLDSRGCPTCRCRDAPMCPEITCPRPCRQGYKTVAGCQTCQCQGRVCPQVRCSRPCPDGYKTVNGCPSCQCRDVVRPPVCPLVLCAKPCPTGYLQKNGCQTCQCKELVIPRCGPICKLGCRNGFVKGPDGCPICKCRPVVPWPRPVEPVCGPISCTMGCRNGFVKGPDGCPICECKPVAPRPSSCRRRCMRFCLISSLGRSVFPSDCDCDCSPYLRLSSPRSRSYGRQVTP